MLALPAAAEPLIVSLSVAFTEPTFKRMVPRIVGAVLTTGRHTIAAVLRTMRGRVTGHCSDYHRVFSRAAWSPWGWGRTLAAAILAWKRASTKRPGRPRVKGAQLPTPGEVVAKARRRRATVDGYGGSARKVQRVHGDGPWYRSGEGLVPVRWVYTHDVQATHRDDYFYSTDPTLDPARIVSGFTGRWPIETTFQEVRAPLGFQTTRQRTENAVLRTGPCRLGLFSLIGLIFAEYRKDHSPRLPRTDWYVKAAPTFSDAMTTVRRLFWQETIFGQPVHHDAFQKIPARLRNFLLDSLTRAA